jgi:hypothetical protein
MSISGITICVCATLTACLALSAIGISIGKTEPIWLILIAVQSGQIIISQFSIMNLERDIAILRLRWEV